MALESVPTSVDAYMARLHEIGSSRDLRTKFANVAMPPPDPRWVQPFESPLTSPELLHMGPAQIYSYVNMLRGSYCQFGCWFGAAFFRNVMIYNSILKDFWAFDSFEGLSKPLAEESSISGHEFAEGRYWCNEVTFKAIAQQQHVDHSRIRIVAGNFAKSLRSSAAMTLKSVSMVHLSTALMRPTLDALNFVGPRLENGALVCCADYFLNRGSPRSGSRGAIEQWLRKNSNFELEPLVTEGTYSRWFVFNRRK